MESHGIYSIWLSVGLANSRPAQTLEQVLLWSPLLGYKFLSTFGHNSSLTAPFPGNIVLSSCCAGRGMTDIPYYDFLNTDHTSVMTPSIC